jgi:hypothetical protein
MDDVKLVTFFDSVQRTIIGELVENTLTEEDNNSIKVKNPLVVNVIPTTDDNGQHNGGMALQLMPVYFRELIKNKEDVITVTYNNNNISIVEFADGFDERLKAQYIATNGGAKMNNPEVATQASPKDDNVIKLFED